MSTIHIPTSFNISITFPAASFHRRLGAWAIDLAILITYLYFLTKIFSAFVSGTPFDEDAERSVVRGIWMFLTVVPIFTYHPLCELLLNGQSIGKKVTQLRVINDKGGRASISQVLIRWLIRTSDYMVLVVILMSLIASRYPQVLTQVGIAFGLLALDIILVNVTARHQRLGDILAHTILIRTTQKTGIEETIFQHVVDTYTPQFPQVLQLSDRDINAIKNILDSARRHHDYALAERAADKIRNHLRIDNSMSPYDFLEILLKDYNYLTTH
ncbi:RDD family protein [Flaviaesturariibacter flavus]|uniref:RDD family protein n=1 Tax=Flaviaesturariibacter flavus TaxID=2502780 RepID=A0A4R1BH20_9BACT|nr:RDD family protein [Flaviaesturariibacter flavus]TCJ16565.1 RDD family protein [Flaviaesturariibacter flavus]